MTANAFAGNTSMNTLDDMFMEALFKGELTVDQTVALRIIKMSVKDYLYFGLGKNGITPERFLDAYEYLFRCRSNDPRTWGNLCSPERYRDVDGTLTVSKGTIQPKEVAWKCFDTHYDTSGLGKNISISNFTARLKKKREMIVNVNIKQVLAYIQVYRREEWTRLPRTQKKGKYAFPRKRVVPTLISPTDSKRLAMLYLYGRNVPTKERPNNKEILSTLLNYKKLLFPEGVL
jgi:hypothetical protein